MITEKDLHNGAIVDIVHLRKAFGDHVVLDDINLSVKPGEKVVVLGPSGSGKSTMLRCINALEVATSGQIFVNGNEITHPRCNLNKIREHLGMVFQRFNLWPHKTVIENLMLAQQIVLKRGPEEARKQGLALLKRVGLLEKADAYPASLSGGQQQRVAIARALAGNPDLIYFDEPTSALDPELTESVLQIIRTLAAEGMTMIVVTHELGFAESIATKAVLLEKGVVVEASDAKAFFSRPKEARTKAFLETFRR